MEKYDKKFYDYLVSNQYVNNYANNEELNKLNEVNARHYDNKNKSSNNYIWMFLYFILLIILMFIIFILL